MMEESGTNNDRDTVVETCIDYVIYKGSIYLIGDRYVSSCSQQHIHHFNVAILTRIMESCPAILIYSQTIDDASEQRR